MLIQVIRAGNTVNKYSDYVTDFMLDTMIKSREIIKFKRGTEWVTIGEDPVRGNKRDGVVNGADRMAVNDSIFVREYLRANP